jgi:anaerobic magnesium-protoporphyrin IX monomethyl ester cyclase
MPSTFKVLFIYPNERHMSTIPPGIALLSQLLKDEGHITGVFDTTFYEFDDATANADSEAMTDEALSHRPVVDRDDDDLHFNKVDRSPIDDLKAMIEDFSPDLLAVSCTETTFFRGLDLIRNTREFSIPNIFGGVFPTFAPHLVMKYEDVDMVCVGEGENALVDLANRMAVGEDYSDVTNLWVRSSDGKIHKNPTTRPVDINKLPSITDIGLFEEKRFYRPMAGKVRRLLPVETHRGCPYTCSFCNSPSQNEKFGASFFRKKDMNLVKEELDNHVKKWKVEYIFFWADTFLAWSKAEFEEFCEMYQDIKLPFWCQTRIETISEEKLIKLKDVGLHRLTFGMEHGNEEFRRRVVNRDYTNESAIRLMQIPTALDIPYSVNNIVGFPGETRELAFDTIELNRYFKSDDTSCSTLVPFHGTAIRKVCEKEGLLDPDEILAVSNSGEAVLDMPQWSREEIGKIQRTFSMYVKFPKDRWPEIELAETDPEIHQKLSEEFIDTFWSDPGGDISLNFKEAAKGL